MREGEQKGRRPRSVVLSLARRRRRREGPAARARDLQSPATAWDRRTRTPARMCQSRRPAGSLTEARVCWLPPEAGRIRPSLVQLLPSVARALPSSPPAPAHSRAQRPRRRRLGPRAAARPFSARAMMPDPPARRRRRLRCLTPRERRLYRLYCQECHRQAAQSSSRQGRHRRPC